MTGRDRHMTLDPVMIGELWAAIKESRDRALNRVIEAQHTAQRMDSLLARMKKAGMADHLSTIEEVQAAWRGAPRAEEGMSDQATINQVMQWALSGRLDKVMEEYSKLRHKVEQLQAYAKHERSLGAESPMIELISAKQENAQLRAVLNSAPRPDPSKSSEFAVSYIDWFFKERGRALEQKVSDPDEGLPTANDVRGILKPLKEPELDSTSKAHMAYGDKIVGEFEC